MTITEHTSAPRYAQNALAWWVHDTLVHPITGTMGLFGRLLRSPRLMALGHHIHNATAPSNDAVADYLEAAQRAGHNETAGDPYGSTSPDVLNARYDQARADGKAELFFARNDLAAAYTELAVFADREARGLQNVYSTREELEKNILEKRVTVDGIIQYGAKGWAAKLKETKAKERLNAFLSTPAYSLLTETENESGSISSLDVDKFRKRHAELLLSVEHASNESKQINMTVGDLLGEDSIPAAESFPLTVSSPVPTTIDGRAPYCKTCDQAIGLCHCGDDIFLPDYVSPPNLPRHNATRRPV